LPQYVLVDIEHLERQIQIIVLAAHDMQEVVAACVALEREPTTGPLCEALATAIAVCYARPFTANTIGQLGNRWTPKSGTAERELHDWLLDERRKRYAHTDEDAQRLVLHRMRGEKEFDALAEIKLPFPRDRLGPIKDMANLLSKRLMAEAFELQKKLAEEVGFDA